jgi:hypothetical protein
MIVLSKKLLLALLALPFLSWANGSIQTGEYESGRALGSLTITKDELPRAMNFSIETLGANGHMCSLAGRVETLSEGYRGFSTSDDAAICEIRLVPTNDGIEVRYLTHENCRYHCGARASFERVFVRPPKLCTSNARDIRHELFLAQYKAKNYAQALFTLDSLYKECNKFFNWFKIDEIRNDLAITQYHLGKYRDCLQTLKSTQGFEHPDTATLRDRFPPADFDAYEPVATATWTNLRLCRSKLNR